MRRVTKCNIVVELSKDLIILLMACYIFSCFSIFTLEHVERWRVVIVLEYRYVSDGLSGIW